MNDLEFLRPAAVTEITKPSIDLDDFFTNGSWSKKQEHHARERHGVPGGDEIYALIDGTVWNSGKHAIVFAESGVHSLQANHRGRPRFQVWKDVLDHGADGTIDLGDSQCRIGAIIYDLGVSTINPIRFCDVINRMCLQQRPQDASPDLLDADMQAALSNALAEAAGSRGILSAGEDVRKERNARDVTRCPPSEATLLLFDCTVFGPARDALLLTDAGLRYKHMSSGDSPAFMPWHQVGGQDISGEESPLNKTLLVGDSVFNLSGSRADPDEVAKLVFTISRVLGHGDDARSSGTVAPTQGSDHVVHASNFEQMAHTIRLFAGDQDGVEILLDEHVVGLDDAAGVRCLHMHLDGVPAKDATSPHERFISWNDLARSGLPETFFDVESLAGDHLVLSALLTLVAHRRA